MLNQRIPQIFTLSRKCVGFPCMKPMFPEAETYVSRMENVRSPPGKHKKQ